VYELLTEPGFTFSEVPERAKTAHEWYKEPKFRPAEIGAASGYPPSLSIYN
jgi:catalase